MSEQLGLRERKKLETRQRIIDVALALFDKRGFERVPVAEIARASDVSEATVFNYFPSKEDLVYGGMQAYEDELVAAVAARPDGTSAVTAFRDFVLEPRGALAADDDGTATAAVARAARIIAGSQTLQAREQRIVDHATDALAELIARDGEAPPGLGPWVAANALMGVHRAMTRLAQRLASEGHKGAEVGRTVRAQGAAAFALLEKGLDALPV
ncbi:TetR family transcriptional regulator [Sinomonas sp. ASV322]|uniref:TetR/AcrR family transcriptional regulator n=1 Tax=Sinomonas sp. ASV322 TaxID=3041920 RepID=UPI0027DC195F|nr:TetR family transcriptional regulator [Sinomonas sp. ASV322]MDQ4504027.1 TetR family transcriptional regulator [Sinomonas sp. ASV322]